MAESLQEIAEQTGGASNGLLGEIITWKAPKETPYRQVLDALKNAGLNQTIAKEILPKNAFQRACKTLNKDRVIRKVRETETEVVYQFTKEFLDQASFKMEYDFETHLTVCKDTGNVRCDIPDLQDEAEDQLNNQIGLRNANDVTRIVQKIFSSYGDLFSIRDQGGAYFAPAKLSSVCDQVHQFLQDVGGKMRRFEIMSGMAKSTESVALSVSERLTDMIEKFNKNVDEFDGTITEKHGERMVSEINGLRMKLESYRTLMGDWSQEIEATILKANKNLQKKIAESVGMEPEPQEPEAVVADDEVVDEVASLLESMEPEPEQVDEPEQEEEPEPEPEEEIEISTLLASLDLKF